MTDHPTLDIEEIREKARKALLDLLGPVNYTRYLQDIRSNKGDYTKERQALPDVTLDELYQRLDAQRGSAERR